MKRSSKAKKGSANNVPESGREMVRADGKKIRAKIRTQYEKVVSDTRKANAEIEAFRKRDEPEYSRWFHANLGALITQQRELSARFHELQALYMQVQGYYLFAGARSMAHAYHLFQEDLKAEEAARNDPNMSNDARQSREDEARKAFEEMFGEMDEDEDDEEEPYSRRGRQQQELPFGSRAKKEDDATQAARVKQVYRLLVQKLHPDKTGDISAEKLELWHKAQEAYEKDDLQSLEALLAVCEIRERGTHLQTSMSALLQVINQLRGALKSLRAQLKQFKNHPGWLFTQLTEEKKIEQRKRLDAEMRREVAYYKMQVDELELEIESWKNTPPPKARKKRKTM